MRRLPPQFCRVKDAPISSTVEIRSVGRPSEEYTVTTPGVASLRPCNVETLSCGASYVSREIYEGRVPDCVMCGSCRKTLLHVKK